MAGMQESVMARSAVAGAYYKQHVYMCAQQGADRRTTVSLSVAGRSWLCSACMHETTIS